MTVPTTFYLFRRSNGVYYVGYFDEGRRRWKSTRSRTKADALKAVTRIRELFSTKPAVITLSSFNQDFLSYAKGTYSSGTVDLYRWALDGLLAVTGDIALSSLTPQYVDRYKTERLAKVSAVSVNIALRSLKAAMYTAVRWKLLENNPFQEVHQVSVPDIPPSYLTKANFQKLLSVITEGWLRELVVFAVSTGMRQGETINLCWQDVDLERKLIHIHSTGTFRTKQGKRRTIPMNDAVHAMLSGKAVSATGTLVFARRGMKIGKSFLQHRFKFYIREARLPEGLHWHSLRHSQASWLVQGGASLYEVQKLLGHSSSRVTEIYSHLEPEQLHQTVNRLDIQSN